MIKMLINIAGSTLPYSIVTTGSPTISIIITRDGQRDQHDQKKIPRTAANNLTGMAVHICSSRPGSSLASEQDFSPDLLLPASLSVLVLVLSVTALARARTPSANSDTNQDYYRRSSPVLFALIGLFMICLGMSVVWSRIPLWPVIAAIFLVLLGGWLLVKGVRNQR